MNFQSLDMLDNFDIPIPGADPWFARFDDPAISVMTDFRERASVTVLDSATIDLALEHMKHTGVRCAFVVDDTRRVVVGLITAHDIVSEKPMRYMQAVDSPRREVLVRDIMQRIADWRVADIGQIEQVTVGFMNEWFEKTSLTHLPVMEPGVGGPRLRGLLSAAKIRRVIAR